jgi:di/tricarboxylate transporter
MICKKEGEQVGRANAVSRRAQFDRSTAGLSLPPTSLTVAFDELKMATRLKFGLLTGFVGLLVGAFAAWVLQEEGKAFPVYVVVPFVVLFALAGVISKRDWIDFVFDFFANVLS